MYVCMYVWMVAKVLIAFAKYNYRHARARNWQTHTANRALRSRVHLSIDMIVEYIIREETRAHAPFIHTIGDGQLRLKACTHTNTMCVCVTYYSISRKTFAIW